MLGLEVRGALDGHRAADVGARLFDLLLGEAEVREQVEVRVVQRLGGDLQHVLEEVFAERPLVEDERQLERTGQLLLDLLEDLVGEALGLERCPG